jgi:hypothetical protein
MGKCIVSISNKMQRYTFYLYLETALHVSGGTSAHHQEPILLYLQHLLFVTPLLLSAAIVEELEPVWVCCGWLTPPTAHSNLYYQNTHTLQNLHTPTHYKTHKYTHPHVFQRGSWNFILSIPEGVLTFYFKYFRGMTSNSIFNFPEGHPQIPLLKFHVLRWEYVTFCETTGLHNSNFETFLTQYFIIKSNYVYNSRNTSFTSLCYTPFYFNALCQFTPLLNLRSLIFGLTPFGWLLFIVLTSYFWWEYNFLFTTFFALSFWGNKDWIYYFKDNNWPSVVWSICIQNSFRFLKLYFKAGNSASLNICV